ncbi:uncharacterized protein LOC121747278 [Salvia splendens]|uniref:uncharacterized protein LOC121747278 n=1 Tax=Salvia splendens TaxID=180675 RepID=UPI001C26F86C|nr:uncharacterized protein LOC121747278 [Salvia splendens]
MMELNGNFLPQFRVRSTRFGLHPSTKHQPLLVVAIFTGEPLPARHYRWKNLEVHCNKEKSKQNLALPKNEISKLHELSFDRPQLTDHEFTGARRREFGHFVARDAILDEEYWTAAWLRAEAHWESFSYMRHIDSYKRKYAEEEFYALKRRCHGQEGKSLNCFCFVAIKKEDKNVRRTVLNSIVGTLDLSIKQFRQGETHLGKTKKHSAVLAVQEPLDTCKYAYIANVCVAKFARRRGIASNMLYLAADVATTAGMKQLFVHVNADNNPAQDLYKKIGFEVVEEASSSTSDDDKILMSMEL